jgi:hypothetical protein
MYYNTKELFFFAKKSHYRVHNISFFHLVFSDIVRVNFYHLMNPEERLVSSTGV